MCVFVFTEEEIKKAKGVVRSVVKKKISHQMYREALFEEKEYMTVQKSIRSDHHELFTISVNKKSLSPMDDKRYILDNKIDTLAHGHWRIKELKEAAMEQDD